MENFREKNDKELFNTISGKYAEKDIYQVSKEARAFQVHCMMDFLKKEFEISKFGDVIEVGCGHGANSKYLQGHYQNFLGVDYSSELIKIAKARYGNSHSRFAIDNIKDIDKHGQFDLIIGIGILHHVDNLEEVLKKLKEIGHEKTIYLFYEPQKGNPIIQILRKIRVRFDPNYSGDQVFFEKKELTKRVKDLGFKNIRSRYNGYLTPPFAQVIMKPKFIFQPLMRFSKKVDKILYRKINSRVAWNFIIAFTK